MDSEASIQALVDRHVAAFVKGDVPAILADYADDAVMVTKGTGIVRGKEAIGQTYDYIFKNVFVPGATEMGFEPLMIAGEIALLHWSASTAAIKSVFAFDSFVIRDGKITGQTGGGEFVPVG
jgi:uncharacterized protein (TIGR02246 family)